VGHRAPPREYLIEIPHSPDECPVAQPGFPAGVSPAGRFYRGCGAGTHTAWIIAELAEEDEAWQLVPRLLRDTARVVPVDRTTHKEGL
jgi:hypothetical protein